MPTDLRIISTSFYGIAGEDDSISGVERLGQRFVLELLTERGSMLYLPMRGCIFLTRLFKHARNEKDVIIAFTASKSQIKRNLTSDENSSTPDDERYSSARLNQIIITDGTVVLEIDVKSRTGDTVRVQTPPILLSSNEDYESIT